MPDNTTSYFSYIYLPKSIYSLIFIAEQDNQIDRDIGHQYRDLYLR